MEEDIRAEPCRRAPAVEEAGGKPEAAAAERQHRAREGNDMGSASSGAYERKRER
jgi:hypothetical protein